MSDWPSALTHAFRSLIRQPTFSLIALGTLALGIGANTAIFSVIKTVVLNPLPYADPERIVVLWEVSPQGNDDRVSVPTFEDWRDQVRSLSAMAAYRHVDFAFAGRGDPRNVPAVRATPELFDVLRAGALLGRTFTREEAVVGRDRVVLLARPAADADRAHHLPVLLQRDASGENHHPAIVRRVNSEELVAGLAVRRQVLGRNVEGA